MGREDLEQTLVLIKPDALKLSLTGYILSQFSEFHAGLRFAGAKIVHVSRMLGEEHYAEHRRKFFFESLIDYITGRIHYADQPHRRRVVALVYCGAGAVKRVRDIAGPTNPHVARDRAPGTVRALGTVVAVTDASGKVVGDRLDNLVHASDSNQEAEREIKLWFQPNDIMPYMHAYDTEVCQQHHYYLSGRLLQTHEAGSTGFLSPGDVAWKSDLDSLRAHLRGEPVPCTLEAIVAKYLINRKREEP